MSAKEIVCRPERLEMVATVRGLRAVMYNRPERRLLLFRRHPKDYKEEMKSMRAGTTVASSMKCGAFSSLSSSSSSRWFGFFGGFSVGVGISTSKEESAWPSEGCEGIVPLCVLSVRVVLNPAKLGKLVLIQQ